MRRLKAGSQIAPLSSQVKTAFGAIDQVGEASAEPQRFHGVGLDPADRVDVVDGGQQPVGHRDGVVGALCARQHRHRSFAELQPLRWSAASAALAVTSASAAATMIAALESSPTAAAAHAWAAASTGSAAQSTKCR